jgi:hypothetical protein
MTNKHILSKITWSRIKRMKNNPPNPPPIVCFAHVTGKTNTTCDCINYCKHSPHKPNNARFNYIDSFDYANALAILKIY